MSRPLSRLWSLTFSSSLFVAIFLGAVLPNLMLDPLQRVSQSIDLIRTGQFGASVLASPHESASSPTSSPSSAFWTSNIGAPSRTPVNCARNIEQLLQGWKEAVLLFDNTGRLLMAGEPPNACSARRHAEMVGARLWRVVSSNCELCRRHHRKRGSQSRNRSHEQPVLSPRDGVATFARLAVSVAGSAKNLRPGTMGTLITLRDMESRRQLEQQLDFSSRLAAISRLTGRSRARNQESAQRHGAASGSAAGEAGRPSSRRLTSLAAKSSAWTTVVKTFLNFNRPVELDYKPHRSQRTGARDAGAGFGGRDRERDSDCRRRSNRSAVDQRRSGPAEASRSSTS